MINGFKENEKSQLFSIRVVKEWTDENGVRHRTVVKKLETKPLNLGSIKNPKNTDVIRFEYHIPEVENEKAGNVGEPDFGMFRRFWGDE